jgi:hypothetical protein
MSDKIFTNNKNNFYYKQTINKSFKYLKNTWIFILLIDINLYKRIIQKMK